MLATSFLECNPGAGFSILISDDSRPEGGRVEGVELLSPADIGIDKDEFHRRATMYGAQGLAASMKPMLLAALLTHGRAPVVYLDADSCVYDDLSVVAELANRCSVALSPHILDPNPISWEEESVEEFLLRAGVFNSGVIGVCSGAEPFLGWWAQRTARRCVIDKPRRLTLEQLWLTLVPALFPHGVLFDRGVNVAGWNLHRRDVVWKGDKPWIEGDVLRHFHFACSYDPSDPRHLTRQGHAHWWPPLRERPGAARLSRAYAQQLLASGYREAHAQPLRYGTMPDGTPIESWMRAFYHGALIEAEHGGLSEPPNPFTHGSERFAAWAHEQAVAGIGQIRMRTAQAEEGADAESTFAMRELASAMARSDELIARIHELEDIRDDAVAWARRSSTDLEDAKRALAERDLLIGRLQTELRRTSDVSWALRRPTTRVTSAVRKIKSIAARSGAARL